MSEAPDLSDPEATRTFGRRWIVVTVYVVAMCMNGLDSTIVNPALYRIAADFGQPAQAASMLETAFLVAMAVALPVSGWASERFGIIRIFLGSLAVFTLASALCAAAQSLGALVACRAVQGAAGGMLTPAGMTMLFCAFAPHERARLGTFIIVPTALMPALGPALGGFLAEYGNWPWLFLVNVPLGIVTLALGIVGLRDGERAPAERFDAGGFVLAGLGLGLLVLGSGLGTTRGWSDPLVLAGLVIGGLGTVALVIHQLRRPHPLLHLGLYHDRAYTGASALVALSAAGLMGMLFLIPMLVQSNPGRGAFEAGLSVFPEAIGLMGASAVVDRLLPRFGPRRLALVAFAAAALVFALVAVPAVTDTRWGAPIALFFVGLCLGTAVLTVQIAGFDTIAPPEMSHAMGLFQIVRTLGGAFGVALVAGVAAAASYQSALVVTALLVAGCLALTPLLPAVAVLPGPPEDGPPSEESPREENPRQEISGGGSSDDAPRSDVLTHSKDETLISSDDPAWQGEPA